MLVAKLTAPVEVFIDKPAVDEKVPPVVPFNVTVALPPFKQKGEPSYKIEALLAAFTVTVVVVTKAAHAFEDAMVYVTV